MTQLAATTRQRGAVAVELRICRVRWVNKRMQGVRAEELCQAGRATEVLRRRTAVLEETQFTQVSAARYDARRS